MAAQSKVTVIYRVQVTKTIHHTQPDSLTLFKHNPPLVKTRLLPTKYKTLKAAQAKAAQYCYQDQEGDVLLYQSNAVVINHTATTPLH